MSIFRGNRSAEPNDSKKKSKRNELIPKLCCLFCAIGLWLLVSGQNTDIQHEITYYGVPVKIDNANVLSENSGLSIISGYDYNINITVRGNRAKLSNYSSEDIIASADVSTISEAGDHDLDVVVSFPPSSGFTVVSQSLESIKVSVDKLTSVEINVDVNIVNAQYDTDAYALGTPVVSPNKVTVRGPQKVLDSISSACVNLDLGKISSNIGFNNRIMLIDSNNEEIDSPYISLSNQYAEGTVPFIGIEEASKIVEKSVPLTCSFKYGYYDRTNCIVNVTPQFVTISGSDKDVAKIGSIDIFTIDETRLTGNTVFTTSFEAPEGTSFVDFKGSAVISVTLSEDIAWDTFVINNVLFDNLAEGLTASFGGEMSLVLRGDRDTLSKIREEMDKELGEGEQRPFVVKADMTLINDQGKYKLPVAVEFSSPGYKDVWCDYTEIFVDVQ